MNISLNKTVTFSLPPQPSPTCHQWNSICTKKKSNSLNLSCWPKIILQVCSIICIAKWIFFVKCFPNACARAMLFRDRRVFEDRFWEFTRWGCAHKSKASPVGWLPRCCQRGGFQNWGTLGGTGRLSLGSSSRLQQSMKSCLLPIPCMEVCPHITCLWLKGECGWSAAMLSSGENSSVATT